MNPVILFLLGPVIARLTAIEASLASLHTKVNRIMTQVQISQESLDEYATTVSDVADEIASDIEALKNAAASNQPLPQANVDSLAASLSKLQGLDQPDTEELPPNPDDQPHPDNTLPGDLPQE